MDLQIIREDEIVFTISRNVWDKNNKDRDESNKKRNTMHKIELEIVDLVG